jgi:hypothetical protein
MTKALITIEVDVDTSGILELHNSGLGESSNPNHPGQRHIQEGKRNYIWDVADSFLKTNSEFVRIVKVSLTKAGA